MLHIPPSLQEYIDLVPGLREHVVDGHITTPLTRDTVSKLLTLAANIESSFTETAAVKALASKIKIQAVLMSTDTREYIEDLTPDARHHLPPVPPILHSVCSEVTCKLCPADTAGFETPTAFDCKCGRAHTSKNQNHHEDSCPCNCTCGAKEPGPHLPPLAHTHAPAHSHSHSHHSRPRTHSHSHTQRYTHDECHAAFRKRYAELKEQYARRHAELKDTYERKYANLKGQYVERELEIKCKYDERHSTIKNKYNELKRRYEALRGGRH